MHVHLHPERLARAIASHFAQRDWLPAHSFEPEEVVATLRARGVERFCFFTYAHRAGLARSLNAWAAETATRLPGAVALGTLHPDDPDLVAAADEALGPLGLAGFKFHCSVQRFRIDDARLYPVYERLEAEGGRLMLHVGTAPYRDAYTGVDGFRRVMARFPRLRVCVAHMGAHETDAFLALLPDHPHLYLDTTMAMAPAATPFVGTAGAAFPTAKILAHQDRIVFGSDFPLIPYDYDEERRWAWDRALPVEVLRKIFHDNPLRFLGPWGWRGGTGG